MRYSDDPTADAILRHLHASGLILHVSRDPLRLEAVETTEPHHSFVVASDDTGPEAERACACELARKCGVEWDGPG